MRQRQRPEQEIQITIWEHVQWRLEPDAFVCHVPNGGWRSSVEASIFVSMGVLAGFPDLLIFKAGRPYALELKAPGGQLTAAQKECQAKLEKAGVTVATATGLDEALAILEQWEILRGRASLRTRP